MTDTAATALVRNLASSQFEGEVYDTLSTAAAIASKLAAAAVNRARVMHIAWSLRGLNRHLQTLVDNARRGLSEEHLFEGSSTEEITPQRINALAENIDYTARVLEYLYEGSKRAGLTNNSLTAGQLQSIRSAIDPLKDIADWLDACTKPKELQDILYRGRAEKERGELFDLKL